MKKILYAGAALAGDPRLQTRLGGLDATWESAFAGNGQEGLDLMANQQFDAVVADTRLEDMHGMQFLGNVQNLNPKAHRLIVVDLNDPEAARRCAGGAHQCVPQPWDPESLRGALGRTFALNIWLSNPSVRELAGRMTRLPSPPSIYFDVVRALQSPAVTLEEIATTISRDVAIAAKLLQLANSASLALRRKVRSVEEALRYVGLETTRSLVLLAHTFSYCDSSRLAGFNLEAVWNHSLATALLAQKIARGEEAAPEVIEESFLAGLLHDIGKLVLAVNLPDQYGEVMARARDQQRPLWEVEMKEFGATHGEIGAQMLAIWNLPLSVIEAVALHHYPAKMLNLTFCPLTAVHVGNAFEHQRPVAAEPSGNGTVDEKYLSDLGLEDRLEFWRQICGKEAEPSTA